MPAQWLGANMQWVKLSADAVNSILNSSFYTAMTLV